MNLHISLLSVATLAAAVMAAVGVPTAAMAQPLSPTMMGGPVAPPSPQESASLLARLAAFDQARETTRRPS